jgi:hypothetical protein
MIYHINGHFFVYKTYKTYGPVYINITSNLADILKEYINKNRLKNNEPLFGKIMSTIYDIPEFYKPSSFGSELSSAFLRVTGVAINANLLRHSRISKLYQQKNLTEKSKEDLAKLMSHQPLTQALYNSIEDEGDASVVIDPIDVYEKDDDDDGIVDIDTVNKELSQKVDQVLPVTKVVQPSSINSDDDDDNFQKVIYNKRGRLIRKPSKYNS